MTNSFFYLLFFISVLVISRLIPHPPNFTPIIASSIMAPLILKDRLFGLVIPISAMFISDIIIGFHPYQFVVYSSILIIGLLSPMKKNIIKIGLISIFASIWFFISTNFAVWIIWDYYPKTIEGLFTCYTLALPFFKNTLISTCFFTGLIIISIKYLEILNKKFNNLVTNYLTKI